MALPTPFSLRAALVALEMIGARPLTTAERTVAYQSYPAGGIYRQHDFEEAERWLVEAGVAELEGERLIARAAAMDLLALDTDCAQEALVTRLLLATHPGWLRLTDGGELHEELIPVADTRELARTLPDPSRRQELLLQLARTIDLERLNEIGALGEVEVVDQCRRLLLEAGLHSSAGRVARVSLVSDQLGYDVVSPTRAGRVVRLEVKTTARSGGSMFLSRNEAEVGLHDEDWALVLCCAKMNSTVEIIGWCRACDLAAVLPTDTHHDGRWTTACINVPAGLLHPGLPL